MFAGDSENITYRQRILKVGLLALTFACLTSTQSVWRSLKASVFSKIVGVDPYVNYAKILSIFFLIPLILFYSKLVDVLRRHQLVYVFTLVHAFGGLIFAGLLMHPTYGLAHTEASPNRILGWAFYLFMESFSAFLSTTFWSFANSVNKPQEAKNFYGTFVAGSKIGGIVGILVIKFFLAATTLPTSQLFAYFRPGLEPLSDSATLPFSLVFGSTLLLGAAGAIHALMKHVPGYQLHGYEAVYQIEKKRESGPRSYWEQFKGAFDGIFVIVSQPYVFGIFMLAFFHDVIITIFDFQVLKAANETHKTAGGLTGFYLDYYLIMHLVGLAISTCGTTPIQRFLGNRVALLIYPFACMVAVTISFFYPSATTFFYVLVILRALNYGLNHPIREVLYIPTTKEIKFKAKAWTDAFGTRIAKSSASFFNIGAKQLSSQMASLATGSLTFGITVVWLAISYFLGRTLQNALDHGKVISSETGKE